MIRMLVALAATASLLPLTTAATAQTAPAVGEDGTEGPAERVGLAVHGRVVVLDAAVVPATEQRPVRGEERSTDRDAALAQPRPGLLERDGEQLDVGRAGHAAVRSRAAGCAGRTVATISAPRSSG